MTNIGIVLPEPGWHAAVRELTRATGTLLVLDETHTLCAGPGGATGADGLDPDLLVIGKAIGGGVPIGAFGMTAELAARIPATVELEDVDLGGIGGTLAGNPLSLAATRATLAEVLTGPAFARMISLGRRWEAGVAGVLADNGLPWHVTRLGCRAEYGFAAEPPRDGASRRGRGRLPAADLAAPARAEPRRAAHAVPQHGAHVPGHDRGRRRPAHRGFRRRRGRPHSLTAPRLSRR